MRAYGFWGWGLRLGLGGKDFGIRVAASCEAAQPTKPFLLGCSKRTQLDPLDQVFLFDGQLNLQTVVRFGGRPLRGAKRRRRRRAGGYAKSQNGYCQC